MLLNKTIDEILRSQGKEKSRKNEVGWLVIPSASEHMELKIGPYKEKRQPFSIEWTTDKIVPSPGKIISFNANKRAAVVGNHFNKSLFNIFTLDFPVKASPILLTSRRQHFFFEKNYLKKVFEGRVEKILDNGFLVKVLVDKENGIFEYRIFASESLKQAGIINGSYIRIKLYSGFDLTDMIKYEIVKDCSYLKDIFESGESSESYKKYIEKGLFKKRNSSDEGEF